MTTLVVERRIAGVVEPYERRPLAVVPRARRRGRWAPLRADDAVGALADVRGPVIVLTRSPEDDPGAAVLAGVAALMRAPVVRLPAEPAAAGWALAVALHPDFAEDGLVRRMEALMSAAGAPGAPPSLRPRVLSRWAGTAWRPCRRCGGGGLAGATCGRCGAAVAEEAS